MTGEEPDGNCVLAAVHVRWRSTYAGLIPADFLAGLSVERGPKAGSNFSGEMSRDLGCWCWKR